MSDIISDLRGAMASMKFLKRLEGYAWSVMDKDRAMAFESDAVSYIMAHPDMWKRVMAAASVNQVSSTDSPIGMAYAGMTIRDFDRLDHEAQMKILDVMFAKIDAQVGASR